MALAGPGDTMLLTNPNYFNQATTLAMLGISARTVTCDPAHGFLPDPAQIADAIHDSVRALARDMTAQLTNIRNTSGVEAVLNFGFGQGPAIVTRNYAQLGMELPFYQSHGVASDSFLELAGSSAEGLRLPASPLLVPDSLLNFVLPVLPLFVVLFLPDLVRLGRPPVAMVRRAPVARSISHTTARSSSTAIPRSVMLLFDPIPT